MENQVAQEPKFKFPTEIVDLPSKGLLYSKDNPLSSGTIEMKYMGAKEEDILTNTNYIQSGVVLDKLLESLIVTKTNLKDLIIGDKNAILIASRILGYGQDYEFESNGRVYNVDLTTLRDKELPTDVDYSNGNEFNFTLNPSAISSSTDGTVYNFITASYFNPYVTTVGLYDENQNLLAIGKLSQPLPTSPTTDTTILINIDR
jgi:hypothetical protein